MKKKKTARALMVLGTASHAGKSIITAALCRIFADDGLPMCAVHSTSR
jgi:adenosylcobyric acid synthase